MQDGWYWVRFSESDEWEVAYHLGLNRWEISGSDAVFGPSNPFSKPPRTIGPKLEPPE